MPWKGEVQGLPLVNFKHFWYCYVLNFVCVAFSLPSFPFLLDLSPFPYAPFTLSSFPFTLPFFPFPFFLSFSPFFFIFPPNPMKAYIPPQWKGLTEKYTPLRKKVNLYNVFTHCKLIYFKLPSSQITDVRMNHRMNIMKDCCQQETTILK